ncbi:asparagine synthase-related protein [Shimia ponticola]|uniref:asparagine synthase-related protein n=1 Tax=Shimia ponticola TaxID=2582893 RepID=UPI0011BF6529|nr:asparagine synthase-related protein [Shimia ponticola]
MSPVLALRIEILACHGLRHGLRYIHPLLDQDLINFALTCPPEFEYRDGLFRAPIRAAMDGIVHDAARLRDQDGLPFVELGLHIARLIPAMKSELNRLEKDPRLHDYFDFDFVRRSMDRQPTVKVAEAHIIQVATTGRTSQWPLNSSFIAISNMMALQKALDEEMPGEVSTASSKPR